MNTSQKVIAWVSILGAGIGGSLATSLTFFKDQTILITAIGAVVSTIVALVVTIFKKTEA
jgi:hypothetical protein